MLIDDNSGPDPAVSEANNAAIKNVSRLVDVIFVVDGEGVLVSFHATLKKKSKKAKRAEHRN